ncbi:MAG TPA: hypothetical protein VFU46_07275 [Gemmatimonadales bacterium]|nr:hypothetical protein [Gemmatimonadales bacterium]
MTTRGSAGALEPSVEAIVTVRQRLHQMGFLLSDEAARELLRAVFAVESARIDRRAREAAAACLRSIQDAAQEALRILTQGPAAAAITQPVPPVPARAPAPAPAPASARPPRDQPVDLAEVVRRRLGEDLPPAELARRPDEVPPPPPPPAAPRRPVFKGRRGR